MQQALPIKDFSCILRGCKLDFQFLCDRPRKGRVGPQKIKSLILRYFQPSLQNKVGFTC